MWLGTKDFFFCQLIVGGIFSLVTNLNNLKRPRIFFFPMAEDQHLINRKSVPCSVSGRKHFSFNSSYNLK